MDQAPTPRRVVAHLDCDAFYASVELRRRPELAGLPVIVAGSGPRAVVTTASYEARRHGVGSAMPAARARRLCPDAVWLPPDFSAYRAASRELWALVRARIDRLQQVGLDEAYAELTDVPRPLVVLRELVSELRAATGITVSVGVGPSRLVAKVCSDAGKPAGFVALGREQACEQFAAAPCGRLPGIGPKTAQRLASLGIESVGALALADEAELCARFGRRLGRYLRARARFLDDSPVEGRGGPAKSRSTERTFDHDVADPDELERVVRRLGEQLCAGLRRRSLRGRTIAIKVRLDDWTTVTRARTVEQPTNDPSRVAGLAVELLRAYAPPRPVRLLGVRVAAFAPADAPGQPAPSPRDAQLTLSL